MPRPPTEAVLAQEFGVSRTVIREAVSRLKNEGMVEPRQGSGVFIVERAGIRPLRIDYAQAVEPGAVVHILALRRAIEAEVASEEATTRRTDEQMAAIDAAICSRVSNRRCARARTASRKTWRSIAKLRPRRAIRSS